MSSGSEVQQLGLANIIVPLSFASYVQVSLLLPY